ncbi:coiled-coil domain-containing protein 153 [Brienomyrus brachyistius]|uniref:coiled-coil domain-containing protein 153 n=1 Tax=Brienomyrus brachyistius TaxID=42636 RepID=UPI0020B261E8|nr:coiled-coil domain-containing protein 153 [Brienomyrus brachyistius]
MPPKKKSIAKVNKTEKKEKSGEVLDDRKDLLEKYRRNDVEVAVLKEHLALRAEAARRAQSTSADLRSRVRELEQKVMQGQRDKRDITTELNRQNMRAQREMEIQVHRLETEARDLSQRLAECREQLGAERDAQKRMTAEKDATIAYLQARLDRMDSDYERILNDCLDSLLTLLAGERQKWQGESTFTHQELKSVLSEVNLNPLGTSWNPVLEVKGWPALQCKWS